MRQRQDPRNIDLENQVNQDTTLNNLASENEIYSDQFVTTPDTSAESAINLVTANPGGTSLVSHHIQVRDNLPIHTAPYHTSPKERDIIQQEMLQNKVIRPSKSPWAAPVVLITKKDKKIRFCVDYRKLNLITKRDVYPLSRIEYSLSALSGDRWFSTMDLTS